MATPSISRRDFDAAIFDMDGVVTRTATVHAAAWKRLFDEYALSREARGLGGYASFDADGDYRLYVDGKPRYDGVQSFLASRGVEIPHGAPGDPADRESVCGLGNRKDAYFWSIVDEQGVGVFESTIMLIRGMRGSGLKTGIFSASRNAAAILRAAGVLDLFDDRVDGVVAESLGLPGKPDPAMLLELTRRLGASPPRTLVFEDAIAGVQAGHRGGFGLVVGVNRSGHRDALVENGADVEVPDLAEVRLEP